jgi:hypothetical protein
VSAQGSRTARCDAGVGGGAVPGASRDDVESVLVSPARDHEQTSYLARAFDNRYRWVRTYSAWNEVNQVSQPTSYVLNASNQHSYLRSHLARYRVGLSVQGPGMFHPPGMRLAGVRVDYQDVNRHTSSDTRLLLDTSPGELWPTETGGLAHFGGVDAALVNPDGSPYKPYSTLAKSAGSRAYPRIVPADTIGAAARVTPDGHPTAGQGIPYKDLARLAGARRGAGDAGDTHARARRRSASQCMSVSIVWGRVAGNGRDT